jgi:SAM-dependent methyltransferase
MNTTEADLIREIDKDSFRQNLRRFTWQAYNLLPKIESPAILDLGCGSGVPTIELAVLSKGRILAVDRDRLALSRLKKKIVSLNLKARVRTLAADISRYRPRRAGYDIIWAEGAVNAIGFEKALGLWRDGLKPDGYLVIHDEIKHDRQKLDAAGRLGWEVVTHFVVPVDAWLNEYFRPLSGHLQELASKYARSPEALEVLRREECEIEVFKTRPDDFASAFYILKKGAIKVPKRTLPEKR